MVGVTKERLHGIDDRGGMYSCFFYNALSFYTYSPAEDYINQCSGF